MVRKRAAGWAIAASFSVYLIPLAGPHAMWLLGEVLFQGEAGKSPKWMALNCAVALVFQLLAAGYFYWYFRKPGWRRGIFLLLALPLVFKTVPRIYMVAIPAMFLEEPDTAPEAVSWPQVCTAPDAYQTNLRTDSELWVRMSAAPNGYAVLTMPGCRLTAVSLPQPTMKPGGAVDFSIDPVSVISEGRAVVQRYETREGRQSWWLYPGLTPLEPPAGHSASGGAPMLSTDGNWVAWMEVIPNTGPPVLNRVVLRPLKGGGEHVVDLSGLGPASYVLQKVDVKAGEVLLWKTDRLIAVGLDGTLRKEFGRPAEARAQPVTYVEMGEYWLAWDAYKEDGRYLVEWRLATGAGSHSVALGRTIHAVAADAAGKWIAVSVGSSLNIGNARDAVYVLRAADGREVFRKYLPRYARTPVAFLSDGSFAYSDLSGVHLLRVPE